LISSITEQGGVTIIALEGRLDAVSAPGAKAELHKLIAGGKRQLVLNLDKIGFIDSAGLGALVSCLRRCAAVGGDLRLAEVPPFCRSIFELTRLTRIFDVNETQDQAVGNFSDGA